MLESGNAAPMSTEIGLSYVAACEVMTSCVSIRCANVGANRVAKKATQAKNEQIVFPIPEFALGILTRKNDLIALLPVYWFDQSGACSVAPRG